MELHPPPASDPYDDGTLSDPEVDEELHCNEKSPLLQPSTSQTTKDIFRPSSFNEPSIVLYKSDRWLDKSKTQSTTWNSEDEDRSLYTHSTRSLATVSLENFKEGLAIPFTDDEGSFRNIQRGLGSLCVVVSPNRKHERLCSFIKVGITNQHNIL